MNLQINLSIERKRERVSEKKGNIIKICNKRKERRNSKKNNARMPIALNYSCRGRKAGKCTFDRRFRSNHCRLFSVGWLRIWTFLLLVCPSAHINRKNCGLYSLQSFKLKRKTTTTTKKNSVVGAAQCIYANNTNGSII